MKDYSSIARNIADQVPHINSCRILEVGSDKNHGLITALSQYADEVIGINIVGSDTRVNNKASFINDNICSTKFEDESFDLIISYAVFEHIHDFEKACKEMFRLLKPQGILLSDFGPIWSCMWGHHLWTSGGGQLFTYMNPPSLPPYCHLLMEQDQLYDHLVSIYSSVAARSISDYIYLSKEQNRLFHKDYIKIFKDSDFKINKLIASRNMQLEKIYSQHPSFPGIETCVSRLESLFGPDDYLASSFSLKLVKP